MNIRELLQPQLEEFQERCVKLKSDEIAQCIDELKANGMNLRALDAYPSTIRFLRKFTTRGVFGVSGTIVEVDNELVKKVLIGEKWRVANECAKYVNKLEQKILQELRGDIAASIFLDGNLWKQSCLRVSGASGRIVTFVTKTIVNKSKYGDYFFQFPTRVRRES